MMNILQFINWYGTYTLVSYEIRRFFMVYNQTIIAPVISALIFLVIIVFAFRSTIYYINEIKLINFIGYGVIIMSIIRNAFANSSSSFIMRKALGYISDILLPPFSGVEIVIAYCCGALVRGVVIGATIALCLMPVVEFTIYHPWTLGFFTIFACLLLGLLGILTGIIFNTFDHAAATSYLITPLAFLSGTFYPVEHLPKILQLINYLNPFFYVIDGFRYSLSNYSDSNITIGVGFLITLNIVLFIVNTKLLNIGWRIKG